MNPAQGAHAGGFPAPPMAAGLLPKTRRRQPLRAAMDPLHAALVLLMVMSISRVHQQFSFLALARPALVLVAFSLLYAFLNPRLLSENALFFTWPPRVLAGFALIACLSVPFGISPGASGLFMLQLYAPVLVFAALLVVAVRKAGDLYVLVWSFVIGGGVLAFFANFVFKLSVANGQARLGDMYMYDANDAGLVLTISIPLTLLTLHVAGWKGKLLSVLFLYWEWIAIARTGSRGAFLGVITVGLGLLLLADGIPLFRRVAVLLGATAVLMIAAPQGYWKQMQSIASPTEDYNWTAKDGRKQVAKRGLHYMLDHPVTGIGISNFPRAEGTISDKARNWAPSEAGIRWSAAHNSHIEAGAELGIPGLLLWLSMLVGGVVGPLRLRRRLPRAWRHGEQDQRFIYAATCYLPISMLGFIVSCTFVSFAYLDPVYVLLAFVSGLYVCAEAALRKRSAATVKSARPSARRVFSGAA